MQKGQTKDFSWDSYFKREKKSFFQKLLSFHRRVFIAPSLKYYCDKYFSQEGLFLEAGAGTSQSSALLKSSKRKLIALDLNHYVLTEHNLLDYKVQANILSLPFRDKCLQGIWNLGVMEHLTDDEIVKSLKEFKRVLEDEGVILLFWPPYFALHEVLLNLFSWLSEKIFAKKFNFFPDEINLYSNKNKLETFLDQAGLKLKNLHFSIRDIFSYMVVAAEKNN
ncbi:MAG: class I SAM-dependent methyltransferase [Candidatus Omnitrophica bacterium]|nr:class I SAM-dependent methyltransferase [Candidatus Omnitrophota bacterium]